MREVQNRSISSIPLRMKSALSMCCFIEQSDSDAYMQPSSSRMMHLQSTPGNLMLSSKLARCSSRAHTRKLWQLGTSSARRWAQQAMYSSGQPNTYCCRLCSLMCHSNVLRLMLHRAWRMLTKHPYTWLPTYEYLVVCMSSPDVSSPHGGVSQKACLIW